MVEKNKVVEGDCIEVMDDFDSNSVDFVMFSPPYDVDKEYEDRKGKEVYNLFMTEVMSKLATVLKNDGRFCVVVPFRSGAKTGRWSRLEMLFKCVDGSGMNIRDMIVWNQNDVSGTAWGSWKSASSPNIQYQTEYVVVGYNKQWKKERDGVSTITADEFKKWTISNIWDVTPDSDRSDIVNHPAPYPEELVERCLKLFTYKDALVFDPMVGSGTTCAVAKRFQRDYIGVEKVEKYCRLARSRVRMTDVKSIDLSEDDEVKDEPKQVNLMDYGEKCD